MLNTNYFKTELINPYSPKKRAYLIKDKLRDCKRYRNKTFHHIIYLSVFASFLNTPHVFFQDDSFYQIWQSSVSHETLSQLPYLCDPIDIFPLCSPLFFSYKRIYSTIYYTLLYCSNLYFEHLFHKKVFFYFLKKCSDIMEYRYASWC